MFFVKECSSNDDNPEYKALGVSCLQRLASDTDFRSETLSIELQNVGTNVPKTCIYTHSETLAKKIYHHGIPRDLKGLALWSAKSFASPDAVMIDVGSHLGMYSMAFSEAGAGAVYSFECNPSVYTALVNNTAIGEFKGTIKTFPFALGDRDESNMGFHNRTIEGNENGFHMYNHEKKFIMFQPERLKPKDGKLHLDMVKFDSLFSPAGTHRAKDTVSTEKSKSEAPSQAPFRLPFKVNFVKVSVNGFEKQVFQGMEAMLTHDSPTLMFQSMILDDLNDPNDPMLPGRDTVSKIPDHLVILKEELKVLRKELFAYLGSLGYKIMKIQGQSSGDQGLKYHFIAKKM